MEPLMVTAATALVTAMTTDAWQKARAAAVALWQRARPDQAEAVADDLGELREQAVAAKQSGDADAERELADSWQVRLRQLLRDDPALAGELKRVLDEVLAPIAGETEQTWITSTGMHATASGESAIYQAGRDQHITGR